MKNAMGIVVRKIGMSRVFSDEGISTPVTVLFLEQSNRVTQLKTQSSDGYTAIQVTDGSQKASRLTKAEKQHFAAANVDHGQGLTEFRVSQAELDSFQQGDEVTLDLFSEHSVVDVAAFTKGKGFAGCVKRHGFRTQDATHGNSLAHRAAGSIGQCQDPGRVFKGKKMAGRMGNVRRTVQNLELVRMDKEKGLLFIKGAVPGAKGGKVCVFPALKKRKVK